METDNLIVEKITEKVSNMAINMLFYNIAGWENERSVIICKNFLGKATDQEQLRLRALNKILEWHEQGKRISELAKKTK